MPRRDCPQCQRRLPYAARRCTRCGWSHGTHPDPRLARAGVRRRMIPWILAALLIAIGGGIATYKAHDVATWYAGFAARHLPDQLSSFAPTDTERGAFLYCARRVVKQMRGEFSIETFPSLSESDAEYLGDGRYRIRAWVDEDRVDGENVRHTFTCTVRYVRGLWALEKLDMEERYAEAAIGS